MSDETKQLCSNAYTCEWCGAYSTIHTCSGCKEARYCGKSCQASHWAEHRGLCQQIQAEREKKENRKKLKLPRLDLQLAPRLFCLNPRIGSIDAACLPRRQYLTEAGMAECLSHNPARGGQTYSGYRHNHSLLNTQRQEICLMDRSNVFPAVWVCSSPSPCPANDLAAVYYCAAPGVGESKRTTYSPRSRAGSSDSRR